jgi:hypothetical protein
MPPGWGAPSIDRHDYIFQEKRRRIAQARIFVELHILGEGPRGHEGPHHTAVLELVLVCVVWAGFLEEPLEVVCRWPCLTLVAVHGSQDAPYVGAPHLSIIAAVVVSRSPLRALLVPLFAILDALLSAVYDDVRWHLLAAAQGHLPASLGLAKHDQLVVGGVLDGDAVRLLKCVFEKVIVLDPERAPCTVLGQRATLPWCAWQRAWCSPRQPCRHSGARDEKLLRGDGVSLAVEGVAAGLCRPVPARTGLGAESNRH